jgi:hypothetical protein
VEEDEALSDEPGAFERKLQVEEGGGVRRSINQVTR